MRVTLLAQTLSPVSGWGSVAFSYCCELAQRPEVDFQVLLPRGGDDPVPDGVDVRRILPPWRASFRRRPQELLTHIIVGRDLPPTDVVHALVEFPYAITAACIGRRLGVPHIVSGQGTYSVAPLLHAPDRWAYAWALGSAAAVTTPSRFTADSMEAAYRGSLRTHVIHNAVDGSWLTQCADQDRLGALGLPPGAPFVLSVGASKPRKGWDVLLRAFRRVAGERQDVHLVLVGAGDHQGPEALAQELGVASSVHVLGSVEREDLAALYQGCQLFALLPRNDGWHFEGFGLVYLEAGACGKPSVGTLSGGVPEVVLDGETGLLVEEDDAEGAADAILTLLCQSALASELGAAARRSAASHSWPVYADRMLGLYDAARLARRATAQP
jgi:phosphatidylinositol alpha-1,6-mannosyltransferase